MNDRSSGKRSNIECNTIAVQQEGRSHVHKPRSLAEAMPTPRSIFISYRRDDSIAVSGRIYDRLALTFGADAIFKDVDNIPLGVNFRKYIDQEVSRCQVLLAIIGQNWLMATDAKGNRRLQNPRDFVRLEIEAALKRDIPVIPILVSGAEIPAVAALPESLQELAERNGTQVRHDPDFHRDMDRLIAGIEALFHLQNPPSAPAAPPAPLRPCCSPPPNSPALNLQ